MITTGDSLKCNFSDGLEVCGKPAVAGYAAYAGCPPSSWIWGCDEHRLSGSDGDGGDGGDGGGGGG